MSKSILRSVGAVAAGLIVIIVLSAITDMLLENNGVLPKGSLPLSGSEALLMAVVAYRALYSLAGCYLAARLAPNRPMKHALALGVVGVVFSVLGAVAMQDKAPAWYNLALVIIALPVAWLGGRLYELTSLKRAK